jgi:cytochrome c2
MSVTRISLIALAVLATPAVFAAEKADVENGKTLFEQRCGICHSITKEGGPVLGPNMVGLIGRKAGSDANFPTYTPALKAYGVKWNAKTLSEFLENPMVKVPGTMMPMSLPDAKERADVVAYMVTLK